MFALKKNLLYLCAEISHTYLENSIIANFIPHFSIYFN
jgi:hypothetical protein